MITILLFTVLLFIFWLCFHHCCYHGHQMVGFQFISVIPVVQEALFLHPSCCDYPMNSNTPTLPHPTPPWWFADYLPPHPKGIGSILFIWHRKLSGWIEGQIYHIIVSSKLIKHVIIPLCLFFFYQSVSTHFLFLFSVCIVFLILELVYFDRICISYPFNYCHRLCNFCLDIAFSILILNSFAFSTLPPLSPPPPPSLSLSLFLFLLAQCQLYLSHYLFLFLSYHPNHPAIPFVFPLSGACIYLGIESASSLLL